MQGAWFTVITLYQVIATVGLSKTTIYERIKTKEFPTPVALGKHCVRWRSDEILAWMEAKSTTRSMPDSGSGECAVTTRQARAEKAVATRYANHKAQARNAAAYGQAASCDAAMMSNLYLPDGKSQGTGANSQACDHQKRIAAEEV